MKNYIWMALGKPTFVSDEGISWFCFLMYLHTFLYVFFQQNEKGQNTLLSKALCWSHYNLLSLKAYKGSNWEGRGKMHEIHESCNKRHARLKGTKSLFWSGKDQGDQEVHTRTKPPKVSPGHLAPPWASPRFCPLPALHSSQRWWSRPAGPPLWCELAFTGQTFLPPQSDIQCLALRETACYMTSKLYSQLQLVHFPFWTPNYKFSVLVHLLYIRDNKLRILNTPL